MGKDNIFKFREDKTMLGNWIERDRLKREAREAEAETEMEFIINDEEKGISIAVLIAPAVSDIKLEVTKTKGKETIPIRVALTKSLANSKNPEKFHKFLTTTIEIDKTASTYTIKATAGGKSKTEYYDVKTGAVTTKKEEGNAVDGLATKFECNYYPSKKDEPGKTMKRTFGPLYRGSVAMDEEYLAKYKEEMMAILASDYYNTTEKKITLFKIIAAVAFNEGKNFDAINGYDGQIASVGIMQKTINPEGFGELPVQVALFKQDHPDKYKRFFTDKGWYVEGSKLGVARMYYMDGNVKLEGKALREAIIKCCKRRDANANEKEGRKEEKIDRTTYTYIVMNGIVTKYKGEDVVSNILAPFIRAGRDFDFQKRQIIDYTTRLEETLNNIPVGYKKTIAEYMKSPRGIALVLDQGVNAPGRVEKNFGEALDLFHQANQSVPKDPKKWGVNHSLYEKQIIEYYSTTRKMTDPSGRYKHIISVL